MTPEFYVKAQALYEEFQKRELYYLNIERKMNSNLLWKKDQNLPLQEYLRKINQREKETDATYQSIMKQMDKLDRHVDDMSFKLDKLGILRSTLSNTSVSNRIHKLDSSIVSNFQNNSTHCPSFVSNILQSSLKSVSTQTEDIYCIKCRASILDHNQFTQLPKNVPPSNMNLELNDEQRNTQSGNFQLNPQSLSKENNEKCEIVKEDNSVNVNNGDFIAQNSKIEQLNQSFQKRKQSFCQISANNNDKDLPNELPSKLSTAINSSNHQSINKEKPFPSSSAVKEKLKETFIFDVEHNMDSLVSKSDAESINNEFDFLESDTNRPFKKGAKPRIENDILSDNQTTESRNKIPIYTEVKFQEPEANSKLEDNKEKKSLKSNPNPNTSDNKSETSESMSGYHSPNVSITSDSDSIYEKGSPLTAAYQALLGNPALKKTPQNVTESESEDEVENAFANAVQRNDIKSKSVEKQKKEETTSAEKPVDKTNKISSMNKPKSKLSKNTRKVLGLDTSSGSDIEMAVKPVSEKKIEEDSDEFDFYD